MSTKSTNDLLKKFQDMDSKSDLIAEKQIVLQESIKDESESLSESLKKIQKEKSLMIAPIIKSMGFQALTEDVSLAKAIYDAQWNKGVGDSNISNALRNLSKDLLYVRVKGQYGDPQNDAVVTAFQVAIPRGAKNGGLEMIAETIEPILKIQKEILSDSGVGVMVDVFEDSLSIYGGYSIRENDGDYWLSYVSYGKEKGWPREKGTLLEILKKVSEKASYRATEEYLSMNPEYTNEAV